MPESCLRVTIQPSRAARRTASAPKPQVVSPGTYIAEAFVARDKIAEETFQVVEGEEKFLDVVGATLYFNAFDAVLKYRPNAQDIEAVEVIYGITNLVGTVEDARIVLSVTRDGAPLDEIPILTLSQLGSGQTSGDRDYSPEAGWVSGEDAFQLRLYSGDTLMFSSLEEVVPVTIELSSPLLLSHCWCPGRSGSRGRCFGRFLVGAYAGSLPCCPGFRGIAFAGSHARGDAGSRSRAQGHSHRSIGSRVL